MYAASEKLVVSGTRDWVMDIRGSFLDCSALLQPPSTPPLVPKVDEAPADLPLTPQTPEPPPIVPTAKRSSVAFISGAFAAAKAAAATKGSSAEKGNPALEEGNAGTTRDTGPDGGGSPTVKSIGARFGGVAGLSMRSFRRSSRTDKGMSAGETASPSRQRSSLPSPPRAGNENPGFVAPAIQARSPGSRAITGATGSAVEERQRSSLFGGSSRSPSTSPRNKDTSIFAGKAISTSSSPSRQGLLGGAAGSSGLPVVDRTAPFGRDDAANARAEGTGSGIGGSAVGVPSSEGGRKGKKVFAGGLWGGGGPAINSDGAATAGGGDLPRSVDQGDKLASPPANKFVEATAINSDAHKPKPTGGGKRRFAGGGLGGPPPPPASSTLSSNASQVNPRVGGGTGATGGAPASAKSGGSSWDKPKQAVHEVAEAATIPAWAAKGSSNDVPSWATGGDTSGVTVGKHTTTAAASNGIGLAPPSQNEQGQEAASKSPFLTKGGDAPPVRRPSQQRPGAAGGGSRRAFGGGQSLF